MDSPKPCTTLSAVAFNGDYVFVASGDGNECNIQVYDINMNTWKLIESVLKAPRSCATASIIENRLYLLGGVRVDCVPCLAL